MSGTAEKMEDWANRSDYTALDLGIFRIIFATASLIFLPNYVWLSHFDAAFYQPAPGPFVLFSSFPPRLALSTLDIVIALALGLLLVGYKTRLMSVVVCAALLTGDGFAYSFGKIDHSILFVLTPLFLGLAGWGDRLSIDARQHPARAPSVNHWAMRAFAVAIGVAFATAAVQKLLGGWLTPSSQATYSYVVQRVERGRSEWLASSASGVKFPLAWELLDWSTVALEGGLLVLAISWRSWRLGLAMAVLFHVGVLLTLNIDFWMNIFAYGAFVRWGSTTGAVRWVGARSDAARSALPFLYLKSSVVTLGVVVALLAFAVVHVHGPLTESFGWVPLFMALVIALWAVFAEIWLDAVRFRSRRRGWRRADVSAAS